MGRPFIDTDALVVAREGRRISELVDECGWAYFRRCEEEALVAALARSESVIGTGGGAVETPAVRARLARDATAVWLRAAPEVLLARIAADSQVRPLLTSDPARRLSELALRREAFYSEVADFVVETDAAAPEALARQIATLAGFGP